jgi:hypothetical protein
MRGRLIKISDVQYSLLLAVQYLGAEVGVLSNCRTTPRYGGYTTKLVAVLYLTPKSGVRPIVLNRDGSLGT